MSDAVPADPAVAPAAAPASTPTPTTPQTPSPEPVKTEPAQESAAARFARLAAQEKRINAQRQELKAAQDAIAKERAEVEEYRKRRDAYQRDPVALLRDHGLTYEQVTQYLMSGGQPTPEMKTDAVSREVQTLRAELQALREERQKAQQEQIEAQRTARAEAYKADIVKLAQSGAYEATAVLDPDGTRAFAKAEALYNETGEVPTPEEVVKALEADLEPIFDRLLSTKKAAAKLPKPPEPKPDAPEGVRSLSSTDLAGTIASQMPKTEAERRARALAAMEAAEKRVAG